MNKRNVFGSYPPRVQAPLAIVLPSCVRFANKINRSY